MALPTNTARLVAVARALGAELDRQVYTHYDPTLRSDQMSSVIVDGDVDLLQLAHVAITEADKLRPLPAAEPVPAQRVPAESTPTNPAVKPAEKPRR